MLVGALSCAHSMGYGGGGGGGDGDGDGGDGGPSKDAVAVVVGTAESVLVRRCSGLEKADAAPHHAPLRVVAAAHRAVHQQPLTSTPPRQMPPPSTTTSYGFLYKPSELAFNACSKCFIFRPTML